MREKWRQCHSNYEVSNLGRVRRVTGGKGASVGHILKAQLNNKGYPCVQLKDTGIRTVRTVHSLVATAFVGPCPVGLEVNHKDGVKTNNVFSNLEYGTRSYNNKHAYAMGLRTESPSYVRGSRHGRSKLTEAKVCEIKRLKLQNVSGRERAKLFGVSAGVISEIDTEKAWTHVTISNTSEKVE